MEKTAADNPTNKSFLSRSSSFSKTSTPHKAGSEEISENQECLESSNRKGFSDKSDDLVLKEGSFSITGRSVQFNSFKKNTSFLKKRNSFLSKDFKFESDGDVSDLNYQQKFKNQLEKRDEVTHSQIKINDQDKCDTLKSNITQSIVKDASEIKEVKSRKEDLSNEIHGSEVELFSPTKVKKRSSFMGMSGAIEDSLQKSQDFDDTVCMISPYYLYYI